MPEELKQDDRQGSLQTELGKDKLALTNFYGSEGLSENFEFRVDAVSNEHNINFDNLLGTNCVVAIASAYPGVKRNFNGTLVQASWNGKAGELSTYQLLLRPWFWLLTRTQNCRIFSEKSAIDIIRAVFSNYGFAKFLVKTTQDYPEMEYCVQYRESDFAFVSRLMEEFGIYYFFDHSESEHTMVLADGKSAHEPKPGGASLSFYETDLRGSRDEDSLDDWAPGRKLRTGKVAKNDYDYAKPKADLLAQKEAASSYANGQLEHYDYPGRFIEKSKGVDLANVWLEGEQAQDKVHVAAGNAVTCCAGTLVSLAKHPEGSLNKEYLTLHASHNFSNNTYRTGSDTGAVYSGAYEFQPSDVPFRAPRVTPKPLMHGPQTAFVVSEVDQFCRIKVQFHWDRDANPSRYVRIGHAWAGNQWGDLKIPRVGMEVIVNFLEGDPDYPLVTGTVYNAENTPPYNLPNDKTISGTKSQTYDGTGYNELILDDRSGSELIRIHGQKDIEVKIEHDSKYEIGNDSTLKVGNNLTEQIAKVWSVEAQSKIEFTVGQSKITMEPAQITITTPAITIDTQLKSDFTSTGITTITGTLVKIN